MNRNEEVGGPAIFQPLSAVTEDPNVATEERLRGSGAEADDNFRLHVFDFGFKPGAARRDVCAARRFMNAALASLFKIEVLHGVCYVHFTAIDARVDQSLIEQLAGRAYEGLSGQILLVARLFPDEQKASRGRAFAKNCLRGIAKQFTAFATVRGRGELLQ